MIGSTIGTYRVVSVLGEGGMGVVYIGEHTLLGRRAAIKVLRTALTTDKEMVHRFFNEARAITQITDPGIVQVFDFGFDADNNAYIVMELLEGDSLARRLEHGGPLRARDALRISRQVATAVATAHAKQIIHRDLKPENVFLVGDPAVSGGERAKILDFGIAKLAGEDSGAMKTQTGAMMGTPVFMSPEQCRGAGEVDHRTDVYSLGCIMMTMLTGRPPFSGAGSGDLIVAHMREEPVRPSSRVATVPPAVDRIVLRCLAKEPSARYQTMFDVARAIADAELALYNITTETGPVRRPTPLPSIPVAASAPTTLSSTAGQMTASRRPRGLVIGLVAAGAIGIAAIAIALATGHSSGEPAPQPVATPPPAPAIDAAVVTAPAPAPIDAMPAAAPADAATHVEAIRPDAGVKRPPKKPPGGNHGQRPIEPVDRGD